MWITKRVIPSTSQYKIILPTELQWQRAAQGDDSIAYPWGNIFDSTKCNTLESNIGHTTPVEQYPDGKSPFKVMDMIGNVWEWCSTEAGSVTGVFDGPSRRVLRGGSYMSQNANNVSRILFNPYDETDDFGFRIAYAP